MTDSRNESASIELQGNVSCPECDYWGDDYETVDNVTGQRCLKCPGCDFVQ